MPFDVAIETPAIRRATLAAALRDEMPDGFTWYFPVSEEVTDCGTRGCALGLARTLWRDVPLLNSQPSRDWLDKFFGLKPGGAHRVFWGGLSFNQASHSRIFPAYKTINPSPSVVADALESQAAT